MHFGFFGRVSRKANSVIPVFISSSFDASIHFGFSSPGFKEGWLKWDDENTFNRNRHFGTLPSGDFESGKTMIEYCCRNDGSALQSIFLPNTHSFYMLRAGTECQRVKDMDVRTEYVQWSREWWGLKKEQMRGGTMAPYARITDVFRVYFCYYEPQNDASTNLQIGV